MQICTVNTLLKKGSHMITTIGEVEKYFVFARIDGKYDVLVEGFNDGFAEISVPVSTFRKGTEITISVMYKDDFISFIAGCFSKKSNFKEKLFRAYGCTSNTEFLGFKLKIGDKYCLITSEKSFIFDIEEAIMSLASEVAETVEKRGNEVIDKLNSNIDEINSVLCNVEGIVFTSESAREKYEETCEENLYSFAQNFVAYVQYLVIENGQNIRESVERAYEAFEKIGENVAGRINEVQFLCKYCVYGDEIMKAYIDIQTRKFSESLGDF